MNKAILLTFLLLTTPLAAQQPFHWESTSGPGVDPLGILEVNTNGDILAGRGSLLLRSTDGGLDWQSIHIPKYLGNISSIATLPGARIVILTYRAIVRIDSDGSNLKTLSLSNANHLYANRSGVLFAFQSSTQIAQSTDTGNHWATITGPASESIDDFTADDLNYYVTTQTGIYTSSDQGLSWRRALNGLLNAPYYGIAAGHSGNVWALCYTGSQDLFWSGDYGKHWSMITSSADIHQRIVIGDRNTALIHAYFLQDSVAMFISQPSGNDLFAHDSSGRWLSAVSQGPPNLFASNGLDWSWQPFQVPFSSADFLLRESSTMMVGFAGSEYFLDSGRTWSRFANASATPIAMDYFDASLLGTSSGTDLLRSTDDGQHWKNILGALPIDNVRVTTAAPHRVYVGTRGVFFTDDAGQTWDETNDNLLKGSISALAADSSGRIYAACASGLYSSIDNGSSWQLSALPKAATVTKIVTNQAETVVLFGSGDTAWRSTDHGSTWKWAYTPDRSTITDISLTRISDVFCSSTSGVYFWQYGGLGFTNESEGLDSIGVTTLALDTAGVLFAASMGRGIFKSAGTPARAGVTQHSEPTAALLSPNPAMNAIRLSGLGFERIDLMDALGRSLMRINFTGYRDNPELDVRALPAGVYYVLAESGGGRVMATFVKQ